jgi:hypothetical protein
MLQRFEVKTGPQWSGNQRIKRKLEPEAETASGQVPRWHLLGEIVIYCVNLLFFTSSFHNNHSIQFQFVDVSLFPPHNSVVFLGFRTCPSCQYRQHQPGTTFSALEVIVLFGMPGFPDVSCSTHRKDVGVQPALLSMVCMTRKLAVKPNSLSARMALSGDSDPCFRQGGNCRKKKLFAGSKRWYPDVMNPKKAGQ